MMHAASRDALAHVFAFVDKQVKGEGTVTVAAQTGIELFEVVGLLDKERSLRVALADASTQPQQRSGIVTTLFGGKIAESTLAVVKNAAEQTWSTTKELRDGLVATGRRSLLRSAEAQGQLEQVEDELFMLSRLLDSEPELTSLLSDKNASSDRRRGLLANVLYGKVTMVTEALALQTIARPDSNPVNDIAAVAAQAAGLRGRDVARVVSAVQLSEGQQASLAEKLGRIYGREMSIHLEVDEDLVGGMKVRVGDEVIDGSIRGKLARLVSALA